MTVVWVLVIIACSGPGPTGDCVTLRRVATFPTRWDCRDRSIAAEMMDDRKRAYCQREKV